VCVCLFMCVCVFVCLSVCVFVCVCVCVVLNFRTSFTRPSSEYPGAEATISSGMLVPVTFTGV